MYSVFQSNRLPFGKPRFSVKMLFFVKRYVWMISLPWNHLFWTPTLYDTISSDNFRISELLPIVNVHCSGSSDIDGQTR